MEQVIKRVQHRKGEFIVQLTLLSSSMILEVNTSDNKKFYYITINNDSMPEQLKNLLENHQEVFQHLLDKDAYEVEDPSKVVLIVKVGKNVRKIPIYLAEKVMSKEMLLEKKVVTLQKQVKDLTHENLQLKVKKQLSQKIIQEQKQEIKHLRNELPRGSLQKYKKNQEVKPKKPKALTSRCIFDVKVYDIDTNLDDLAAKIQALQVSGVVWSSQYKKIPIAYGISKLQMKCFFQEGQVLLEEVFDWIRQFDQVQSIEVPCLRVI